MEPPTLRETNPKNCTNCRHCTIEAFCQDYTMRSCGLYLYDFPYDPDYSICDYHKDDAPPKGE